MKYRLDIQKPCNYRPHITFIFSTINLKHRRASKPVIKSISLLLNTFLQRHLPASMAVTKSEHTLKDPYSKVPLRWSCALPSWAQLIISSYLLQQKAWVAAFKSPVSQSKHEFVGFLLNHNPLLLFNRWAQSQLLSQSLCKHRVLIATHCTSPSPFLPCLDPPHNMAGLGCLAEKIIFSFFSF